MVQWTVGGKSVVIQTSATLLLGFTLVIDNTLSLSINQAAKVKKGRTKYGNIVSFYLDCIKKENKYNS